MSEELSRKIAEHLEPLSTLPSDDADKQDMDDFPTECWLSTFRLSHVTGMHVPAWHPRDMVHDPAMTVMLLEKMLVGYDVLLESNGDARFVTLKTNSTVLSTEEPTFGEAVALAYAKMEGLI